MSGIFGMVLLFAVLGGSVAGMFAAPFWLTGYDSAGNWIWFVFLLVSGFGMFNAYRGVVMNLAEKDDREQRLN